MLRVETLCAFSWYTTIQFSEGTKWQRKGVTNWKLELFEYLRLTPFSSLYRHKGKSGMVLLSCAILSWRCEGTVSRNMSLTYL
jgi:hypothetical protein